MEARTSPGFNFDGGVGKILHIHKITEQEEDDDESYFYDVRFMLDGHKEYKVEEEIIESCCHPSSSSSSLLNVNNKRLVKEGVD